MRGTLASSTRRGLLGLLLGMHAGQAPPAHSACSWACMRGSLPLRMAHTAHPSSHGTLRCDLAEPTAALHPRPAVTLELAPGIMASASHLHGLGEPVAVRPVDGGAFHADRGVDRGE